MLQKKFRLGTKDVRFLTRKGVRYYGKYFSFHSFFQYPSILHNQISCHISIKYDKRAVYRNAIKRMILAYIQDMEFVTKQRNGRYYKLFIGLNKHHIEHFKAKMQQLSHREQKMFVFQALQQHLREREKKLLYQQTKYHNVQQGKRKNYIRY